MVQRRRREGRPRYFSRRKVCSFCVDKIAAVDYKDLPHLRRHLSEWARVDSRRKSGTCARHQRQLSTAVKRARHLALLPFTAEHVRISHLPD